MNPFSLRVIESIRRIPSGKVATYGQIARLCGNPRAARQVSRILHSCSEKHDLPWYRVINSQGTISLAGDGKEIQTALLMAENVNVGSGGHIDLERFLWTGPF